LAFVPSPELLYQLPIVQMKATQAKATAEQIQNHAKSARTLAQLGSLIEAGTLPTAELEDFVAGLPRIIKKAAELPEEHLFIAPSWEIVRSGDGLSVRVISNPQARNIGALVAAPETRAGLCRRLELAHRFSRKQNNRLRIHGVEARAFKVFSSDLETKSL
jgi:hypothetical protein